MIVRHTAFNRKFPDAGTAALVLSLLAASPPAIAGSHSDLDMPLDQGVFVSGGVGAGQRDRFTVPARTGQFIALRLESGRSAATLELLLPGAVDPDDRRVAGRPVPGTGRGPLITSQASEGGRFLAVVTPAAGQDAQYRLWVYVSDVDPRPMLAAAETMLAAPTRLVTPAGVLATGVPMSREEPLIPPAGGATARLWAGLFVAFALCFAAACAAWFVRKRAGDRRRSRHR